MLIKDVFKLTDINYKLVKTVRENTAIIHVSVTADLINLLKIF